LKFLFQLWQKANSTVLQINFLVIVLRTLRALNTITFQRLNRQDIECYLLSNEYAIIGKLQYFPES